MGKIAAKDIFSNIAYASVTASAVNTLTFSEINTGVSVHEKIAWVISKILWYPKQESIAQLTAADDILDMALTLNNKVSDIAELSDPAVIDLLSITSIIWGTPVGSHHTHRPFVRDFTSLPGGGLIITPKPLYVAVKGTSLVTAEVVACRILYTIRKLAADEFWELVQASRIVQ